MATFNHHLLDPTWRSAVVGLPPLSIRSDFVVPLLLECLLSLFDPTLAFLFCWNASSLYSIRLWRSSFVGLPPLSISCVPLLLQCLLSLFRAFRCCCNASSLYFVRSAVASLPPMTMTTWRSADALTPLFVVLGCCLCSLMCAIFS